MRRKANTHSYFAVTPNFVGRFNFRLADLPYTTSSRFKIVASRSSLQDLRFKDRRTLGPPPMDIRHLI